jgi:DNA-binding transcriptional MerR regulator
MPEIPDKVYFKIGEVSRLAELKPYVLRYWETEFGVLRPKKSRTGQRLYRRSDVEMVLRIKTLLKERRFTIAGARAELRRGKAGFAAADDTDTLRAAPSPPQPDEQPVGAQLAADPALLGQLQARDELLQHLRAELEQLRSIVRQQLSP